jgi:hypothetical protein
MYHKLKILVQLESRVAIRRFTFRKNFSPKLGKGKGMGYIYFSLSLIAKTAQWACLMTNSATLPIENRFQPV